jgi:hypothetical protein
VQQSAGFSTIAAPAWLNPASVWFSSTSKPRARIKAACAPHCVARSSGAIRVLQNHARGRTLRSIANAMFSVPKDVVGRAVRACDAAGTLPADTR